LAGLCESCAFFHRQLDRMPQYDRSTMTGDFHDVVGGVRVWFGEIRRRYFVDTVSRCRFD
jgi:hypothetical protein